MWVAQTEPMGRPGRLVPLSRGPPSRGSARAHQPASREDRERLRKTEGDTAALGVRLPVPAPCSPQPRRPNWATPTATRRGATTAARHQLRAGGYERAQLPPPRISGAATASRM